MRDMTYKAIFIASLVGSFLQAALARIADEVVMEFAKFHLLEDIFVITGRPSPETSHKLIFAVKQDTDLLDSILLDVSQPTSPNYGLHLSRDQVFELTSNGKSHNAVKEYLTSFEGITSVKMSKYEEFITAEAPIGIWENMFETVFFTVGKKISKEDLKKAMTKRKVNAVRTLQYKLPKALRGHVTTVLNTVQAPLFEKTKNRSLSAGGAIDLTTGATHDNNNNSDKDNDNEDSGDSGDVTSAPDNLQKGAAGGGHGGNAGSNRGGKRSDKDKGQGPKKNSLGLGLTYPFLINQVYNIKSNTGSASVSQGVFASGGQVLSKWDLQVFQTAFGLPLESPAFSVGGHVESICNGLSVCAEANLDVQYIMALAQNVPTTFWYTDEDSSSTFMNWVVQVAEYADPPKVFSISYGIPEHYLTFYEIFVFDTEMKKLGLQGVTVLSASGDSGVAGDEADPSKCGYNPEFPASSPYVTSVGATQGPELGLPEISCSLRHSGFTAGGGFSNIYETPIWQKEALRGYFRKIADSAGSNSSLLPFINATSSRSSRSYPYSNFNSKGRGYPDISLLGVKYVVAINGSFYPLDGTSAASPVAAAMVSLVNSQRAESGRSSMGFLNPALYMYAEAMELGDEMPFISSTSSSPYSSSSSSAGHPRLYTTPQVTIPLPPASFFRDVTSGDNKCLKDPFLFCCPQGFTATEGWDPVTGFGSIDHQLFSQFFSDLGPDLIPYVLPIKSKGGRNGGGVEDGSNESVGGRSDDNSGGNDGKNNDDTNHDIKGTGDGGMLSSMAAASKDTHLLPLLKLLVTLAIVCVCAALLVKSLVQLILSKCRGKRGGLAHSHMNTDTYTETQAGHTHQYRVIYPSVQIGENKHLIQSDQRGVTYSSVSDERNSARKHSVL